MFDTGYRMLGAGARGWAREMILGRRWERGSGLGTHVYLWLIHVHVWQNQYSIVKQNKVKIKFFLIFILMFFVLQMCRFFLTYFPFSGVLWVSLSCIQSSIFKLMTKLFFRYFCIVINVCKINREELDLCNFCHLK